MPLGVCSRSPPKRRSQLLLPRLVSSRDPAEDQHRYLRQDGRSGAVQDTPPLDSKKPPRYSGGVRVGPPAGWLFISGMGGFFHRNTQPKLGGHVDACDGCGEVRVSYNSCRNRHCPKCQAQQRAKWLENRSQDLLPVPYFHVVFTRRQSWRRWRCTTDAKSTAPCSLPPQLPSGPSPPTRSISALISFIAVAHLGPDPVHHPHLHCVIPGGGLAPDTNWISCRDDFFLPVRVTRPLSRQDARRAPDASLPIVSTSTALLPSWQIPLASEHSAINCGQAVGGVCQATLRPVQVSRPLQPSCRHRQLKDHGCQFATL